MLSQACRAFVIDIEPPLLAGELSIVAARLRASWPPGRLAEFTREQSAEVVRLATICLGMSGDASHYETVTSLLKHDNQEVAEAAENAFWSLSFREYGDVERLQEAVASLRENHVIDAIGLLDAMIETDPDKAEAHHQRGLALQAQESYDEAALAYQEAIQRNPYHFAALAGAGHVCIERDEFHRALDFYKRALDIHPRLEELRDIVPRLEAALRDRDVA